MAYQKPVVAAEYEQDEIEPRVLLAALAGAAIGAFLAGLVVGYFFNP